MNNLTLQLLRTALTLTFGRHGYRPFRTALARLGCAWLAATSLGWALANSLINWPTAATQKPVLVFTAIFTVQLVVLCTILASYGLLRSNNVFARMLITLPLSQTQRWLSLLMPSIVLVFLALSLVALPLAVLFKNLGLPLVMLPIAFVFGSLAAFGMLYSLPKRLYWAQLGTLPLLLWGEYMLIGTINNPALTFSKRSIAVLLFGTLLLGLCLLFGYSKRHLTADIIYGGHVRGLRTTFLPPPFWFAKKLWRTGSTRLGFIISLALSSSFALVGSKLSVADPYFAALIASVLAAAFTSDIRSLSRRLMPPEIVTLRGTIRFVHTQLVVALLSGSIVISPLVWAILAHTDVVFGPLAQITAGICIGFFAGTIVAPAEHDVLGQFIATLMCTGLIVVIPQLPIGFSLDTLAFPVLESSCIAILVIASYFIEYRRNKYKWRDTNAST